MKTIDNVKVYRCEYCGKISLSKGAMANHERICKINRTYPTGAECFGCKHLKTKETQLSEDYVEEHRCFMCPNYKRYFGDNYGFIDADCIADKCDRDTITDFVCEVTGKTMYYPRRVLKMNKRVRDMILSRCDCEMPQHCEHKDPEQP